MATTKSVTRILTRRDSCTQALKRLGVPQPKYNDFILCLGPGEWQMTIPSIEQLAALNPQLDRQVDGFVESIEKPSRRVNPVPAPGPPKPVKITIAKRCLMLFQEGKSNKEVLAIIKEEFKLPDDGSRDHYPAWYRSYFRRNDKLPRKKERHA